MGSHLCITVLTCLTPPVLLGVDSGLDTVVWGHRQEETPFANPSQLFRLNPVSDIYGVLLEEKKIIVIVSIKSTNIHLKSIIFKLLFKPFQEIMKNHDLVL